VDVTIGDLGTVNATFTQGQASEQSNVLAAEAQLKADLANGISTRVCWIVPGGIFATPTDWTNMDNVAFSRPDADFSFAIWGVVLGCVIFLVTLISVAFVFWRHALTRIRRMLPGRDSFSKVDDNAYDDDSDDQIREASEEFDNKGVPLI